MPATAILQFIGIIVFTNQLSTDGHLQAIIPRIPGPGVVAGTTESQHAGNMIMVDKAHGTIEEHMAVIVFPTSEYLPASTWTATHLRRNKNLSYVELDGESVTLTTNQIPSHPHVVQANSSAGTSNNPAGNVLANEGGTGSAQVSLYTNAATTFQAISPGTIGNTGGSQPHDNMAPFLVINFILSLFGIFPSQT